MVRSKTLPWLDRAVEDRGKQLLDVGPGGSRSAGQGDVATEEAGETNRGVLVLGHADAADRATGPHDTEGLLVRRHVADGLQDNVGPEAARQLAYLLDAFVTALRHDIGGTELAAQVGARLVPAHQDDLLGTELLRGEHRQEADRTVADDRDGRAGGHLPGTAAW